MNNYGKLRTLFGIIACVSYLTLTGCEDNRTNPDQTPFVGSVLLVANYADGAGNMSSIELESGAIIHHAAGLGNSPNDMIEFDNRIFVLNSLSNNMNILRLMDNNTLEEDTVIELGNGNPMNGAIAGNGFLYISNGVDDEVTVYDTYRSRLLAYLPVGKSPADVIVTNGNVYVCNTGLVDNGYEPGTLSVIPISSGLVEGTISVGTNPQYMATDPDGRLHVVCSGNYGIYTPEIEGEINIINTMADTVESYIYIGGQPREIVITENGFAYVTAGGWEDEGYVFRYNAFTGQILNGPDNPIVVGLGAWGIAADDDGTVYVGCWTADAVYKIIGDEVVDVINQVGDAPGPMLIYRK